MVAKPSFVYVEDDTLSQQVMELLLVRGLGYSNLTIFEDSHDFMSRLEALPAQPDAIFLDIHVKPHDGFALLDMIRRCPEYARVVVVAVTASVMNEEVAMLKDAGFDGAIGKPIDQVVFPEFVRSVLRGENIWHVA